MKNSWGLTRTQEFSAHEYTLEKTEGRWWESNEIPGEMRLCTCKCKHKCKCNSSTSGVEIHVWKAGQPSKKVAGRGTLAWGTPSGKDQETPLELKRIVCADSCSRIQLRREDVRQTADNLFLANFFDLQGCAGKFYVNRSFWKKKPQLGKYLHKVGLGESLGEIFWLMIYVGVPSP